MNERGGTELNSATLRPHPSLRTLWMIQWALVTLVVMIPFVGPWLTSSRSEVVEMTGGTLLLWLIIALPFGVWIPLYLKNHETTIDQWQVSQRRGFISKKSVSLPLANILSVEVSSGPLERLFGVERLKIYTSEQQLSAFRRPMMVIPGLADAEAIGALLLRGTPSFSDALGKATGSDRELMETILDEVRTLRRETGR